MFQAMPTTLFRALAAGVAGVLAGALAAHAVQPSLGNILPRGVARGGEATITLYGSNLSTAQEVLIHEEGNPNPELPGAVEVLEVAPESGDKVSARLAISEDAPVGLRAVRVRTNGGISNLVRLSISTLPAVDEAEPNNTREEAQAIELNTTVNGVVQNEDQDFYAIELEEGARLAVEVEGIRLGNALFDPKLRLFGPGGHERVSEDDTQFARQDASFTYAAMEGGTHYLVISEAAYGGANDYRYRLHVGTFARPAMATPLGGRPGETINVRWLGDPGIALNADGAPAMHPVVLPAIDPAGPDAFGGMTVPVTVEHALGAAPTPLFFRVMDVPGVLEIEPNNTASEATPGSAPGAFDGVLETEGDIDFYRFEAKKGAGYHVRVWARALGSPADSVLHIRQADGTVITGDDDSSGVDSYIRWGVPEDGAYTLSVKDHLNRGGEDFAYRVEITPIRPEVRFRLENNEPARVVVPQGNRALALVRASKSDYNDVMMLDFEGLPQGVAVYDEDFGARDAVIPVVFTAAADAPIDASLVQLVGTPSQEAPAFKGRYAQQVELVTGQNQVLFEGHQLDNMALAVTEPAPFKIDVQAPQHGVPQNAVSETTVTVERAEGFTSPIQLDMPWSPDGFNSPTATIAEGADSAVLGLGALGGAETGPRKVIVRGTADGWSVASGVTEVAVTEPWASFSLPSVEAEQGADTEFVIAVTVHRAFEGEHRVVLRGLPRGISTQEQMLTGSHTELVFPIAIADDSATGEFTLDIRAAITADGQKMTHAAGGGVLRVHKPAPPALQAVQEAPAKEEEKPEKPKRKTRFPSGRFLGPSRDIKAG